MVSSAQGRCRGRDKEMILEITAGDRCGLKRVAFRSGWREFCHDPSRRRLPRKELTSSTMMSSTSPPHQRVFDLTKLISNSPSPHDAGNPLTSLRGNDTARDDTPQKHPAYRSALVFPTPSVQRPGRQLGPDPFIFLSPPPHMPFIHPY